MIKNIFVYFMLKALFVYIAYIYDNYNKYLQ